MCISNAGNIDIQCYIEYMLVVFKPGPSSFVTRNWKHLWERKVDKEQISQKEKAYRETKNYTKHSEYSAAFFL